MPIPGPMPQRQYMGVPYNSLAERQSVDRDRRPSCRSTVLLDKGLSTAILARMNDDLPGNLGRNIKQLREARTLTQAQLAKVAVLPRATLANLESGAANPTLQVLHRVALA